MADFRSLELKPEPIPEQLDDTPKERGAWLPPLPPGDYEFRMPMNVAQLWGKFVYENTEYVYVSFDKDSPLVVVATAPGQEAYMNYTWQGVVNNMPKDRRTKREKDAGNPPVMVSDMLYLIRAFDPEARPSMNNQYAEALSAHAGGVFGASNEWKAACKKGETKWLAGADGRIVEDPLKGKGCGKTVFQRDLQEQYMTPEGNWPLRITCPTPGCLASLRTQGELRLFRPGTVQVQSGE